MSTLSTCYLTLGACVNGLWTPSSHLARRQWEGRVRPGEVVLHAGAALLQLQRDLHLRWRQRRRQLHAGRLLPGQPQHRSKVKADLPGQRGGEAGLWNARVEGMNIIILATYSEWVWPFSQAPLTKLLLWERYYSYPLGWSRSLAMGKVAILWVEAGLFLRGSMMVLLRVISFSLFRADMWSHLPHCKVHWTNCQDLKQPDT